MASIRCRYAPLAELPVFEARAADRWLSPAERRAWDRFESSDRRATWLGGRILSKRMVIAQLIKTPLPSWERAAHAVRGPALETASQTQATSPAPAEIHIESRSGDAARGQRPCIFVAGRRLAWALSIAHTSRGVLVALGYQPGIRLGVDLVCRETDPRQLYWTFTTAERRWLAAEGRDLGPQQLWACKEALYKACQQGEGFAPGRIEVVPGCDPHYPASDPARVVRRLQCWRVDGQLAALAVVEAAEAMQHEGGIGRTAQAAA
jgi:phosphopantetheinyl transferase